MITNLILWACLYPIAWSVVEYLDVKRFKLLIPEPKAENEAFDDVAFGIWLLGFAGIIQHYN